MTDRTLRVLALGDLVGRPGRRVVRERLRLARERERLDFVIVNVENAANGAGTRGKDAQEILAAGADCLTNGDHVVDFPEYRDTLEREPRALRPCNYVTMPGRGSGIYDCGEFKVAVANVAGAVFMKALEGVQNPFASIQSEVRALRQTTPIVFVDVHAEATSEKIAMGWMLDGQVSAVFGSHTHVQTSDAQVLPQGTGYLTDLGMTGPHHGVIGRDKEAVFKRFLQSEKVHLNVASGWARMMGAIFTVDPRSGRCLDVSLFRDDLIADKAHPEVNG